MYESSTIYNEIFILNFFEFLGTMHTSSNSTDDPTTDGKVKCEVY